MIKNHIRKETYECEREVIDSNVEIKRVVQINVNLMIHIVRTILKVLVLDHRIILDSLLKLFGLLEFVQCFQLVKEIIHCDDLIRSWNNLSWDLILEIGNINDFIMTQTTDHEHKEPSILCDIIEH